jgi:hypothetical protein
MKMGHNTGGMSSAKLLNRTFRTLTAVLREIFDESAYARFLRRHHLASSRESYAAFLKESAVAKSRRAKCC